MTATATLPGGRPPGSEGGSGRALLRVHPRGKVEALGARGENGRPGAQRVHPGRAAGLSAVRPQRDARGSFRSAIYPLRRRASALGRLPALQPARRGAVQLVREARGVLARVDVLADVLDALSRTARRVHLRELVRGCAQLYRVQTPVAVLVHHVLLVARDGA